MQAAVVAVVVRQQARLVGLVAEVQVLQIQSQQAAFQEQLTLVAAAAAPVQLLIHRMSSPALAAAALFGYGIQTAMLPQQQQDHRL